MSSVRRFVIPIAFYLAVIVVWEIYGLSLTNPSSALVPPSTILDTLWTNRAAFLLNTGTTLAEAAAGLAVAIVVSVVLALVVDRFRLVGEGIYRLALVIYAIPLIALAPALVAALGLGVASKIAIAALGAYFPILVNLTSALRTLDPRVDELGRVLAMGYFSSLFRLRAPAVVPSFFSSLKIAGPAAFIAAIIAEWIGAESGLGLAMMHAMFGYQMAELWAILLVATVVNGLIVLVFDLAGRWASPWHASSERKTEV